MHDNFFSQIYHQATKKFSRLVPMDSSKWPEEWKTTFYKTYLRFRKIDLLNVEMKSDFFEAVKSRSSKREMTGGKISKEELSVLLKYSCGNIRREENGDWRRAYPSGGARYPIEIYGLLINAGTGLEPGLFHYNVKSNQLEIMLKKQFLKKDLKQIAGYEFVESSSLIIFMTSVFWRNQNKYGDRGYRFILQESGHIGQNFYLISEILGLKCCALGGFRVSDEEIEKILRIDGTTESLVYTLVIGK